MDEWPVTSGRFSKQGPVRIEQQPKMATERCELARQFANEFGVPLQDGAMELLVDNPELGDPFESAYAPWPIRLYLIQPDNTIEWIAQPKDCSYDEAVVELLGKLDLFN